jgi:D-alanyl-D-alanine endopeptidase (penicillin-binding protein 7)
VNNIILPIILALTMACYGAEVWSAQSATETAKPRLTAKKSTKRSSAGQSKGTGKAAGAVSAANATSQANGTQPSNGPDLKSSSALIIDAIDGATLYAKNSAQVSPIASITKLMTAMVVLDAALPLDEPIRIERADIDNLKHTGSRLRIGSVFSRHDLLHLALMSSENRAASALGRNYPGGLSRFVAMMNEKAAQLGMDNSRFVEPTGLSSENVSTAEDLALMVAASMDYPLIREFSTAPSAQIYTADSRHVLGFFNSNGLVRTSSWQIDVSKTGYISESGRCLVMQARIMHRPVIIVLLDSWGKYTRIGDANRVRKWLESGALHLGDAS